MRFATSCQHGPQAQLVQAPFGRIQYPTDNAPTDARIHLGRLLFYDTALSAGGGVSCATCHQPAAAFASHDVLAPTAHRTGDLRRNVPTLTNAAYQHRYFFEGFVRALERQSLGPINNAQEMGVSLKSALQTLGRIPAYATLAQEAYRRPLDAYVVSRALSAYERTLVSHTATFDRYIGGHPEAMSVAARQGYKLFLAAQCGTCHAPPLFASDSIANIGLSVFYADEGLQRLTQKAGDAGKFKTPTLRNVALTAPYMHDGSLPTLAAVLAHYNRGGPPGKPATPARNPNQSLAVHPLHWGTAELAQITAFLNALTDSPFIKKAVHEERLTVQELKAMRL